MEGYGICGIGERRAYVWGNTGVRLMLSDGEVFLGHGEPEKIMQDLNSITAETRKLAKIHEASSLFPSCTFVPFVVNALRGP